MPDLGGRIRSAESKEFRIPLPILEIRHLEGFRPPKAEALRTLRDATSALVEFVMKAVPERASPFGHKSLFERHVESLNTIGLEQQVEEAATLFLNKLVFPLSATAQSDPVLKEELMQAYTVVLSTRDFVVRSVSGYDKNGLDICGEASLPALERLTTGLQALTKELAEALRSRLLSITPPEGEDEAGKDLRHKPRFRIFGRNG